jgi:hypothetical protein
MTALARPTPDLRRRARIASATNDSLLIGWRNLKRIPRIPELAIFAILQSIMFVLLFAFVFGGAIVIPGGGDYKSFLMPGIFAQTIVFAAGATTPGCYRALRQDASFLLSGARAAEVFLQTCGFDFRQPPKQLVMTRVVGVSCQIWRRENGGVGIFQMWCDGTYGAYLWHTLLEIVRELNGDAVGVACFFPELHS